MKRINYFLLILSVAAGLIALASCNKQETENPGDDEVYFEIDPEGTIECFADDETIMNEIFGADGSNDDEQKAELREVYLQKLQDWENKLSEETGSNSCVPGYISYKFYYYSKDIDGSSIRLSGRVAWGRYWFFGWHNADPDNIYLLEHYTITDNSECPSENGKTDMFLVTGDNLLIMPDYIGYGETKERLHPYLNHEIVVQNSIDAIEPAYAIWKKYGSGELEDDWKMYVMGASQGASNALAVHKYFDTHEDFAKKWRFDYSYCCCGAYDPRLTMQTYYKWGKTAYVGAIPMTIKSMLASYPKEMKGFTEDDFYSEKYLKIKDQIDEILEKKQTNTTDLNHKIKELLKTENPTLEDMLSKDALDQNSELCKAFFTCLENNNLVGGWTPKHKIHIYGTTGDEIVPYDNTAEVIGVLGNNNMVEVVSVGTSKHVATCYKWYATLMTGNW